MITLQREAKYSKTHKTKQKTTKKLKWKDKVNPKIGVGVLNMEDI